MSELAKKEDQLFRDWVVDINLGRAPQEEKHLLRHRIMSLSTVDPEAIKMMACIESSCPFLVSKEPSVDVEKDNPSIETQKTSPIMAIGTSSGMKTIQSIMFGENGAMTKIYADGTTSR